MSITLTPELEAYVEERARVCHYPSTDEVVREAVRRMKAEEEQHEQAVLEGLRSEVSPLRQEELDEVRQLARRARNIS